MSYHRKIKKGQEIFWLSVDSNCFQDCIPITRMPVVRLHSGTVESVNNNVMMVKTMVNMDFIKNFEGVITGLKVLKNKGASNLQFAIIGIPNRMTTYTSREEAKYAMVTAIINDGNI